jgi:hypothetical protein
MHTGKVDDALEELDRRLGQLQRERDEAREACELAEFEDKGVSARVLKLRSELRTKVREFQEVERERGRMARSIRASVVEAVTAAILLDYKQRYPADFERARARAEQENKRNDGADE